MRTLFKFRRWGKHATIFALIVTWLLFGIWHGAGWNFMLLGFLQAVAIYYEYSTKRWRYKLFSRFPNFLKVLIGRISTYIFYGISLVFFFSNDMSTVQVFFSKLFDGGHIVPNSLNRDIFRMVLFFSVILISYEVIENDFTRIHKKITKFWNNNYNWNIVFRWSVYFVVITIVIVLNKNVQQFIYFQF
jgi:D-alanyl-lipoteichoic acid acyltransferase DltB (MBOAT superfamily)